MKKISAIQFFVGLIITAILTMLLFLGLKIFLPEPVYPQSTVSFDNCRTLGQPEQTDCLNRANQDQQQSQKTYDQARKNYSGQIFVFANIFGLLLLIIGVIIFATHLGANIAVAFIGSGSIGILYAYILGWSGADDALKFIVGLVVAALAIGGAVAINRMHNRPEGIPPAV